MQGQDTNLSNVIIIYSINLETDVMQKMKTIVKLLIIPCFGFKTRRRRWMEWKGTIGKNLLGAQVRGTPPGTQSHICAYIYMYIAAHSTCTHTCPISNKGGHKGGRRWRATLGVAVSIIHRAVRMQVTPRSECSSRARTRTNSTFQFYFFKFQDSFFQFYKAIRKSRNTFSRRSTSNVSCTPQLSVGSRAKAL